MENPIRLAVIDPNMGNLRSVVKAFEHLGAHVNLATRPETVENADALIFPGQGAITHAMKTLKQAGFDVFIRSWIAEDRPFFGICLGLQALFTHSEEGSTPGLDIFPGEVLRFRLPSQYKIPHMGWNTVRFQGSSPPLAQELSHEGEQFYFVHSYYVKPQDPHLVWCETVYGHPFVSGIRRGNCFATQFHPEKSQAKGLQLYKNFLQSIPRRQPVETISDKADTESVAILNDEPPEPVADREPSDPITMESRPIISTETSPPSSQETTNPDNQPVKSAVIRIEDTEYPFPIITGTEGENAIDISTLRSRTDRCITYDEGYGNTGSCQSSITFIDGEKGILRHRGYPIEELAEHSLFLETTHLIIYGELPDSDHLKGFIQRIRSNAAIHESMRHLFEGFPSGSHPMAILAALLNSLGCYYPQLATNNRARDLENFSEAAEVLIAKVHTIAAMAYRMKKGLPIQYPRSNIGYAKNFLHMMFSNPYEDYEPHAAEAEALDLIFLLHADHEQNCSTSTVRMVASGGANLFASVSAGVSALWGPLHGGANMAVIKMLHHILESGDDGSAFLERVKAGEQRLMGFGHRVYKNYDPRARILSNACRKVLESLKRDDPLLDIARRLEAIALKDPYCIERKLYPNVDFYSGIILQAIGLPLEMFTVIFAIGRLPGWIAHWKEIAENPKSRIHRPRQIYIGPTERPYVPVNER